MTHLSCALFRTCCCGARVHTHGVKGLFGELEQVVSVCCFLLLPLVVDNIARAFDVTDTYISPRQPPASLKYLSRQNWLVFTVDRISKL